MCAENTPFDQGGDDDNREEFLHQCVVKPYGCLSGLYSCLPILPHHRATSVVFCLIKKLDLS